MDALLFAVLLVLCCGFAGLRGGAPERIGAALLVSAAILSLLLVSNRVAFSTTEWGIFGIDCALLAGLFALAMFANRYWPLWLTSLQLVTIWSHLAFGTVAAQMPLAYAISSTVWSFPMLIMLALGTHRYQRRIRKFAVECAWSKDKSNDQRELLNSNSKGES